MELDKCTLLDLLRTYDIVIPPIQRDYVQGRKDVQASNVRKNLLIDIKNSLNGITPPLDLGFIYGSTKSIKDSLSIFEPVDGQQRLTTLFLLYVYAYSDDSEIDDTLKRFSYEARPSTRDFIASLIKHRAQIFISNQLPSDYIEDAEWFVDSWKYDPSVNSVMIVLDDIALMQFDKKLIKEEITRNDNPKVYFHFIKLDNVTMEDDLYIKLNARGRPLTKFESFKSRFEDRCHELYIDDDVEYYEEILTSLDTKWSDVFWDILKSKYDEIYLNYFKMIFMNTNVMKIDEEDRDDNWIYEIDYKRIDDHTIRAMFNLLTYLNIEREKKDSYLYKDFSQIVSEVTYSNRVLLHSMYTYFMDGESYQSVDYKHYLEWYRVFKNLTNNTLITGAEFNNCIETIEEFIPYKTNILTKLSALTEIMHSGFDEEQRREECIKAKIMLKGDIERDAIINAEESLKYFNGQIGVALYYSNLLENDDVDLFEDYINKLESLFVEGNNKYNLKYGNLIRRALCTLGDYRLNTGSYVTLCIDNPDNRYKRSNLKGLFNNHGKIVKDFLDKIDASNPIDRQLHDMINSANIKQNDWRYCIVKYDNIINLMSATYLRMIYNDKGKEWLLIRNKGSRGYNYSLYLSTLSEVLEKKGINSIYETEFGREGDRRLIIQSKSCSVKYSNNSFIISNSNKSDIVIDSDSLIDDTLHYIENLPNRT